MLKGPGGDPQLHVDCATPHAWMRLTIVPPCLHRVLCIDLSLQEDAARIDGIKIQHNNSHGTKRT